MKTPNSLEYRSGNILGSPLTTAHSGPELCTKVPSPVQARKLAGLIVSPAIRIVIPDHSYGAGGTPTGLRFDPR
jgi:hypothetical protein